MSLFCVGVILICTVVLHRHRFSVRAARMGYGVMQMDTDVLFFHDPYQYLKSSPLNQYQFIIQKDHTGRSNVGWYYLSNVSPDGAVAWMVSQVPDRFLR